jgi:fumarylacetoacetate (FAA) hydrolase
MGVCAQDAVAHIKLVVVLNDWSLRALAGVEMKTGFGWIQAKPACSMAPFAVTPDELGPGWHSGRVQMRLRVERNGAWFGEPHGGEMSIGFHDLIAHAAATRNLCAGTIIGSGTVSNRDYKTTGSTCIAERRAIETLESGSAVTEYLQFGERIRITALDEDGASPFGEIDQQIIKSVVR